MEIDPKPTKSKAELLRDAREIRRAFLKMHYEAQAGHLGTGLSTIELLTYVYGSWLGEHDRFILSKGHGASALYATLHHYKRLSDDLLKTYYKDGTLLPMHPAPGGLAEIPVATGSLGHGLPIAAGLAFARKLLDPVTTGRAGPSKEAVPRVACLISDGECDEGSTWEGALFSAHHKLDNLVVIIDANGLQGFGRTQEVMNNEPFAEKWRAFNFEVREIDGHDFGQIGRAFAPPGAGKPVCILARTTKGKGVSYMEDRLEWHYLPMKEEQYLRALSDLEKGAS